MLENCTLYTEESPGAADAPGSAVITGSEAGLDPVYKKKKEAKQEKRHDENWGKIKD